MRPPLPPLNTLRLFEAAGRRGSFREAAAELHVTPSAVSHAVQALEDWLGVPLFVRGPRSLSLTAAGNAYLPCVRDALQALAVGAASLPGRISPRAVRLTAAPMFVQRCILPRLDEFRSAHPGVDISIDTSPARLDLDAERIDLAIRLVRSAAPNRPSRMLLRPRLVPVCAPGYLADKLGGVAEGFAARATLIRMSVPVAEDWDAWFEGAGIAPVRPRSELRFDTVQLVITAAERGYGVVLGRMPLIAEELAAGTLVKLSDIEVPTKAAYWLVRRDERETRPEVLAFEEWLGAMAVPDDV